MNHKKVISNLINIRYNLYIKIIIYIIIKMTVNILPMIVGCFGLPLIYNSGNFPKKSMSFKESQNSIYYINYEI